jgi:hypothetical protein
LSKHTNWGENCTLIGPGSELLMIQPADIAKTLADGMRDGAIMIPSHTEAWDTVKRWAQSPDEFIRQKISDFARGEVGIPRMPEGMAPGARP